MGQSCGGEGREIRSPEESSGRVTTCFGGSMPAAVVGQSRAEK